MGDDPALKPRIVLPSFKDVKQRGKESTRLRSNFQQSGSSSTPAQTHGSSALAPAGSAAVLAHAGGIGAASGPAAPRPIGFTVQHSAHLNTAPTPSNTLAHPSQPDSRQGGASVLQHSTSAAVPLQTSSTGPASSTYSAQVGQGNAILVNRNQQGNPVLEHIRNVNYRFAAIVPDFQFNDQTAAIFLSLRFHRLKPQYMATRIKTLNRAFRVVLVCVCDVEDPVNALAEVAQGAVDHNVTLIVAFSEAECARYLELLKVYENKQADALRPQTDTDYVMRVAKVLTHVRAVNRTDSALMGSDRRSLASIFKSTEKELSAVPGLGPAKVKRLFNAFDSPFYMSQRKPELPQTAPGKYGGESTVQLSESEAREWIATQQVRQDESADTSEEDEEQ